MHVSFMWKTIDLSTKRSPYLEVNSDIAIALNWVRTLRLRLTEPSHPFHPFRLSIPLVSSIAWKADETIHSKESSSSSSSNSSWFFSSSVYMTQNKSCCRKNYSDYDLVVEKKFINFSMNVGLVASMSVSKIYHLLSSLPFHSSTPICSS